MTAAPALSPDEQAQVDRFGIFEPEEREAAVVEAVARAIHDDDCDCEEWPCLDGWDRKSRRLAVAAVAAYRAVDPT